MVACSPAIWFANVVGVCAKENGPPKVDITNGITLLTIDVA